MSQADTRINILNLYHIRITFFYGYLYKACVNMDKLAIFNHDMGTNLPKCNEQYFWMTKMWFLTKIIFCNELNAYFHFTDRIACKFTQKNVTIMIRWYSKQSVEFNVRWLWQENVSRQNISAINCKQFGRFISKRVEKTIINFQVLTQIYETILDTSLYHKQEIIWKNLYKSYFEPLCIPSG